MLVTHVEPHASAVSLVCSREWRIALYKRSSIKKIINVLIDAPSAQMIHINITLVLLTMHVQRTADGLSQTYVALSTRKGVN